jgi:hypothetical protein
MSANSIMPADDDGIITASEGACNSKIRLPRTLSKIDPPVRKEGYALRFQHGPLRTRRIVVKGGLRPAGPVHHSVAGDRSVVAAAEAGPHGSGAPRHPQQKGKAAVGRDLSRRDPTDQIIDLPGKAGMLRLVRHDDEPPQRVMGASFSIVTCGVFRRKGGAEGKVSICSSFFDLFVLGLLWQKSGVSEI